MKKYVLHFLILILVAFQLLTTMKINQLQSQLEATRLELSSVSNRVQNDMGAIYANVDEMLQQKASLLEYASYELGMADAEKREIPIAFEITPKVVGADTTLTLEIDGVLFPMQKNGTTFIATLNCDMFGKVVPKILIEENGVKYTTQDDRINVTNLKEAIFPLMYPRLIGGGRYDGTTYHTQGNVEVDYKESQSGIKFTQLYLTIAVDGKVISNIDISDSSLRDGHQIDEKIPLSKGQIYTMQLIAIDSIGLRHQFMMEHWDAGSNNQREPLFGDEQIFSEDGTLLWKTEYGEVWN